MGRHNPYLSAMARAQTGENHPRWKGDAAQKNTGRHRAQAIYKLRPCEQCGVDGGKRLIHRHHKDGDPLNNSPENIAFLCTRCHAEAHKQMRKDKELCHLLSD